MSNYKLNTVGLQLQTSDFFVICSDKEQNSWRRTQWKYLPFSIQQHFPNHEGYIYYTFDRRQEKRGEKHEIKRLFYYNFENKAYWTSPCNSTASGHCYFDSTR